MELLVFFILAILAIASALAMITARNMVHGVLFMVVNFVATAVLFLLLNAAFLAVVQVIVYAGAIMVLFLFVVMLLGPQPVLLTERTPVQRPAALLFGLLLLVGLLAVVSVPTLGGAPGQVTSELVARVGNPRLVGELLFSRYVLPFEITSVLLLVAMVGAVVLAKRRQ
jgi:NADH-quinone oxidoreductase subunit J